MNILLADDQPRVRFALKVLLEQQPGWSVAGEAQDAAELLAIARDCPPDLVLLDGDLPGLECARHLPALRSISPEVRIVALSDLPCGASNGHAAGASNGAAAARPDAYASKSNPPEHLLAALRACLERRTAGATVFSGQSTSGRPDRVSPAQSAGKPVRS